MTLNRWVLITVVLFCISACGVRPQVPIVRECPKLQLPAVPVPPVRFLKETSSPDEVIKSWVATAHLYRDWQVAVSRQVRFSK